MKIGAYIYTVNRNNSFKLDPEEIKDVQQDVSVYLSQKSYNDQLIKKTILSYYQRAVQRKIKQETIVAESAYLENFDEEGTHEVEEKRRAQLDQLNLNDIQRKIVALLISGYQYPEIRRKLRLNKTQLWNHIHRIKQQNAAR